jgi:hypothetical protein
MSVQMIELEEVQMVEQNDEALEAISAPLVAYSYTLPSYGC